MVVRVPEVVQGYPDRILPKDEPAAQVPKTCTLANLYNERPAWLENAHRALDVAVAKAYDWEIVILWAVNTYLPHPLRLVPHIVVIVVLPVALLAVFGLLGPLSQPIGRLR